jgi:hypothetical protein
MNPLAMRLLVSGLLLSSGAVLCASGPGQAFQESHNPTKGRGKFTIGKETTYITTTLDKDGYPDYATALNERLREGVTRENNATTLLCKVLGPHPRGARIAARFFQWLGIPEPPEKGDYFIDLSRYLSEQLKIEPAETRYQIEEQLHRATQRCWQAKEHPQLASWLKANQKPLGLTAEASRRPCNFMPLGSSETDQLMSGLVAALSPLSECRQLAMALAARALLHGGEGAKAEAWQDLLACHRLGRLVGHGRTALEAAFAVFINNMACRADLAFLDHCEDSGEEIKNMLRDLRGLPPLPDIPAMVEAERLVFLSMIMMLDREGARPLNLLWNFPRGSSLLGLEEPRPKVTFSERVLQGIDWDPALRTGNRLYDRLAAAVRDQDRSSRERKLEQLDAEIKRVKARVADPGGPAKTLESNNAGRAEAIADMLIDIFTPPVHKTQTLVDRATQEQNNVILAFALAWYRSDHGHYPKTLEALLPGYLDRIPQDLFSGKRLIYIPSKDGYLLYSVGVNGRDEGGRGHEDQPPGDDLSVRMPLPELRQE